MTRAIFLLFAHFKHLSTMISMKQTTSIFVTPVTVINRIKIPRKNTTANVSSKNDVEKETAEEEETNKIGSEEEAEATIEEKKIPERRHFSYNIFLHSQLFYITAAHHMERFRPPISRNLRHRWSRRRNKCIKRQSTRARRSFSVCFKKDIF